MKRVSYFIVVCASILLSGCNRTQKFDQNLSLGFEKAKELTCLSGVVGEMTSRTWHKAIFDNKDHTGQYCFNFNYALETFYDYLEDKGTLQEIRTTKKELNVYVKAMADCPRSRKNAYDDFINYVTDVMALADLALEPKGSLNAYSDNIYELVNRIKKEQDVFDIKYGEFLVEVNSSSTSNEDW